MDNESAGRDPVPSGGRMRVRSIEKDGLPSGAPAFDASPEAPASPHVPATTAQEGGDRSGVFEHLVTDDADITGLVAYSIYKQHKLDWLRAFRSRYDRLPNEAELASYIIGEGTPRRLATYRHLAEATLVGNGPQVGGGHGETRRAPAGQASGLLTTRRAFTPALIALYGLIAILFILGFMLALHYTATSR